MFHVKHCDCFIKINMKIKDHFLSQEKFEIIETEIQGIYKTSPLPDESL